MSVHAASGDLSVFRRSIPWLWALLIWLLLSLPPSLVPGDGGSWPMPVWLPFWLQLFLAEWGDKMLHFLLFTVLSALMLMSGARWRRGLLACAAYAALTELYHLALPYRSAEWGDFWADLAGVVTVACLAVLGSVPRARVDRR